jgi:hypothetical protein
VPTLPHPKTGGVLEGKRRRPPANASGAHLGEGDLLAGLGVGHGALKRGLGEQAIVQ